MGGAFVIEGYRHGFTLQIHHLAKNNIWCQYIKIAACVKKKISFLGNDVDF